MSLLNNNFPITESSMSKRCSKSGDSPTPKRLLGEDSSDKEDQINWPQSLLNQSDPISEPNSQTEKDLLELHLHPFPSVLDQSDSNSSQSQPLALREVDPAGKDPSEESLDCSPSFLHQLGKISSALTENCPADKELSCSPSFLRLSSCPPLALPASSSLNEEQQNWFPLDPDLNTEPSSQPQAVSTPSANRFSFLLDCDSAEENFSPQNSSQSSSSSESCCFSQYPENPFEDGIRFDTPKDILLADALLHDTAKRSLKDTARTILENSDLKNELLNLLLQESHDSLKSSLKHSQLCANKNDRQYLLSLTPRNLVGEFKKNSFPAFRLLVQGLLGIADPEAVFDSQYLLNNVCFVYSSLSKVINRKASGYALLMTSAVRDGGLREDSIKLFSVLVHPRTSQKYDKNVLSQGWDQPLQATLKSEREHFQKLHDALLNKSKLTNDGAASEEIDEAGKDVTLLLNSAPPQVQAVWDNLNLRTKHRFEREKDEYCTNNFDWMASIFIKDRIDANHMLTNEPVKNSADLKIEDFVPTQTEKNYILQSMVYYFSHRLVHRYPQAFKHINSVIKPNKPHQFQSAMDSKSEEFTGELFTKSETKTEDLISMMSDIQEKYVHTFQDEEGNVKVYEKKILSGDNKTEKNQTYGIIRLICDEIVLS